MKKRRLVILLTTFLILSLTTAYVFGAETPLSPGPAPDSGDCIPSGNPGIRPDAPGKGPAPNSGDGDPDGSGF